MPSVPKIALFCLLAPFALMELLFYRRFDLLLLGGLYFALAAQADWSAARFLHLAKKPAREKAEEPEAVEVKVHRLDPQKSRTAQDEAQEAPRRPASPDEAPTQETVRRGRVPRPRRGPTPNFAGTSAQILAVDENACTRTIVNAFRQLIKRFHPDHALGLPTEMANDRVQRLTAARDDLLQRRRGRRSA